MEYISAFWMTFRWDIKLRSCLLSQVAAYNPTALFRRGVLPSVLGPTFIPHSTSLKQIIYPLSLYCVWVLAVCKLAATFPALQQWSHSENISLAIKPFGSMSVVWKKQVRQMRNAKTWLFCILFTGRIMFIISLQCQAHKALHCFSPVDGHYCFWGKPDESRTTRKEA